MAGITDLPFRSMVLRFGAGLVVSEMVASEDMVNARPSTRARAELAAGDARTSVQIAGREARWMAEAARMLEGNGARVIDINMGCPAKKVTNGASGSALMRDPDHALSLIEATVNAVSVPVTLKMRLGWDHDCLNAPEIARRAEEAGVRMIVIHGRTRQQFYKGRADWAAVRHVVENVTVPVVTNGDIVTPASAREALRLSGAAGVMIGRGAQGRPWLLAEIAAALTGRPAPARPRGEAFADLILEHYERQLAFYDTDLGVRTARKHLTWYLEDYPDAAALRARLVRESDPNRVRAMIRSEVPDLGAAGMKEAA